MPCAKIIAEPSDTVYIYDGSLTGFYCCVYESVYAKQLPSEILRDGELQPSFSYEKYIETDEGIAGKVRDSIGEKISKDALGLVENVFFSCLSNKEMKILRFLLFAYGEGPKVMKMLGHPDVAALLKAQRHFWGEWRLLLGFIRFSDYGGRLAAQITPKNFVLPYLAGHFISRYRNEDFLIYDKTHKAALIYENRKKRLVSLEDIEFSPPDGDEENYRALWKKFYDTVAIKERYNPKCRMTHMPKRYWENMPEVRGLL